MTRENLKKQFKKFTRQNPPLSEIEKLFNKALNSGALDYENDSDDSYRLAKIIYHAILCTMAYQWQPFTKENRETAGNLKKFI